MKSFRQFCQEDEDYRGQHEAPDSDSGAPMHDVTLNGIYPKDFYSYDGFRYYSDNGSPHDHGSHYDVVKRHNKPYTSLIIYRAVPKDKNIKAINPGDWVTHNRNYAVEHGRSNIGIGKWKILAKTAQARDLFTDGNSIHEWGYHPQERDEGWHEHQKKRQERFREIFARRDNSSSDK